VPLKSEIVAPLNELAARILKFPAPMFTQCATQPRRSGHYPE
jgi:hypothetical protein